MTLLQESRYLIKQLIDPHIGRSKVILGTKCRHTCVCQVNETTTNKFRFACKQALRQIVFGQCPATTRSEYFAQGKLAFDR